MYKERKKSISTIRTNNHNNHNDNNGLNGRNISLAGKLKSASSSR